MKAPVAVTAALLLASAACGDDGGTSAPATTASATTSSGAGGQGGAGGGSSSSGGSTFGGDRPVEVLVPDSYDPSVPAPLLLLLHGYTATGELQSAYFGLEAPALERGMLYAHPDGTIDPMGNPFWNATDACCDFYGSGVDDEAYLRGLIDEISAVYNVDPKRVYFVGHSNGGFMSYRMACDDAGVVAAIAGLAGATYANGADCSPSEPVHVLHVHGNMDRTVPYEGGSFVTGTIPGAVASVEYWAVEAGCNATPTDGTPLDLESSLTGDETTVSRYADGCMPGGSAELWTIVGGGHIPELSTSFATSVLDWLLAHPKP
jgi:polyhydroxybutyrate depolymerase